MYQLVSVTYTCSTPTSRLEELYNRPNSDMLEGGIGTCQEAIQIFMHAAFRFVPYVVKCRIVVRCRSAVWSTEFAELSINQI